MEMGGRAETLPPEPLFLLYADPDAELVYIVNFPDFHKIKRSVELNKNMFISTKVILSGASKVLIKSDLCLV